MVFSSFGICLVSGVSVVVCMLLLLVLVVWVVYMCLVIVLMVLGVWWFSVFYMGCMCSVLL